MKDEIVIDKNTPSDELMTAMELVLGRIVDRIGVAATVGTLLGTAILMTIENSERHV